MTVHRFASTGDAYNAIQCDEAIKTGDCLLIESEGVVGIADTWPIALTVAHGELHTVTPGREASWTADCGVTPDQVYTACLEAIRYGYAVGQAEAWLAIARSGWVAE